MLMVYLSMSRERESVQISKFFISFISVSLISYLILAFLEEDESEVYKRQVTESARAHRHDVARERRQVLMAVLDGKRSVVVGAGGQQDDNIRFVMLGRVTMICHARPCTTPSPTPLMYND